MRVLGTAVLVFEWIVLALAIPVAVNVSGVPAGRAWLVFGLATVLTAAAIALLSRPVGIWLGWSVQVVMVLGGIVVPVLAILGVIFAGLWLGAIRFGTKVDRIKAERATATSTVPPPA